MALGKVGLASSDQAPENGNWIQTATEPLMDVRLMSASNHSDKKLTCPWLESGDNSEQKTY